VKKLNTGRGRGSKIFNEHKLTIGLDLEIARATTGFWMKQAR